MTPETETTPCQARNRAVTEAFVRLQKKGLIYRDVYLVNWCPHDLTAISDDEVEYKEIEGHLWHIRYPLADGGGHVTVATTRPETLLGDCAVAVHPGEPAGLRYLGLEVAGPAELEARRVAAELEAELARVGGQIRMLGEERDLLLTRLADPSAGVAHRVVEALAAGVTPLLPRRLSYPEVVGEELAGDGAAGRAHRPPGRSRR